MRASDVVVLAAPSTPQTRKIINTERLALLPAHGIIINIARGDLIDDDALIRPSRPPNAVFGAAGLDVFANEPKLDERYLSLDNVFLQTTSRHSATRRS